MDERIHLLEDAWTLMMMLSFAEVCFSDLSPPSLGL